MQFQDPHEITCPHCAAAQLKPVKALLDLAATCDSCGKGLSDVGEGMRSKINDWSSFVGMIELVMAIEARFGCSISDYELEASDTANAFVSLIRQKKGGLSDDEVLSAIKEAMRSLSPNVTEPEVFTHSLRDLLSPYRRAES